MLLATIMISCDKEVSSTSLSLDKASKATINGYVYADTNLQVLGKEAVSAGKTIILTIPYSNFTGFSSASGNWTSTVTTDANGHFVIQVPTDADGVTVTFTPVDFVTNQIQPLNSHFTSIPEVFSYTGTAYTLSVKDNDSKVKLIDYDTNKAFDNFNNIVTITGYALAETDNNNSVEENSPLVNVVFSTTGWSKQVTLTPANNGKSVFTVDVPNSSSLVVSYSFNFTTNKNVSDGQGGWVKQLFLYKGTKTLTNYTSDTDGVVLDFGAGTKVDN